MPEITKEDIKSIYDQISKWDLCCSTFLMSEEEEDYKDIKGWASNVKKNKKIYVCA